MITGRIDSCLLQILRILLQLRELIIDEFFEVKECLT